MLHLTGGPDEQAQGMDLSKLNLRVGWQVIARLILTSSKVYVTVRTLTIAEYRKHFEAPLLGCVYS